MKGTSMSSSRAGADPEELMIFSKTIEVYSGN